jgi:hypothetical protein
VATTYHLVCYLLSLLVNLRLEIVAVLLIVDLKYLLLKRLVKQVPGSVGVSTPMLAHLIDLRFEGALLLLVLFL